MGLMMSVEGDAELQGMIELLQYYPEIFDEEFYPAMKEAAELVKQQVGPLIPWRTGFIAKTLGSKVIHSGTGALATRAVIGYGKRFTDFPAWYIGPLDTGARPHDLDGPTHVKVKGQWKTIWHHPGFEGRQFQERGFEASQAGVDGLMEGAAERVVERMGK
jgi:hypothetical protein